MKSKIMTKAMALLLAVVLSFTLVIPSTFATTSGNADEISIQTAEESAEAVEDSETDGSSDSGTSDVVHVTKEVSMDNYYEAMSGEESDDFVDMNESDDVGSENEISTLSGGVQTYASNGGSYTYFDNGVTARIYNEGYGYLYDYVRNQTGNTSLTRSNWNNFLLSHASDDFYLGTPYPGWPGYPTGGVNGNYDTRNAHGLNHVIDASPMNSTLGNDDWAGDELMQCTGFVWNVMYNVVNSNGGYMDFETAFNVLPCRGYYNGGNAYNALKDQYGTAAGMYNGKGNWRHFLTGYNGSGSGEYGDQNVEYKTYWYYGDGSEDADAILQKIISAMNADGYVEIGDILYSWDGSYTFDENTGTDLIAAGHDHIGILSCNYFESGGTDTSMNTWTWWNSMGSKNGMADEYQLVNCLSPIIPKADVCYAITAVKIQGSGEMQLQKVSSNTTISANNSCYSLAGAEYYIAIDPNFTNYATDVDGNYTTLITDENGNSNVIEYSPGTYYVKEAKASPGYALDPNVYTVEVKSGERTTFTSTEVPVNDDVGIILTKISEDENLTDPPSLANAEFTIKYYDGYYDSTSNLPSSATRTWVIKTVYRESTGEYQAILNTDCKISGDDFYYDNNGLIVIPLGTITIQETKAAKGYTLDGAYLNDEGGTLTPDSNGVILMQVTQNNSTSGAGIVAGNYFTKVDVPIRGGVAVYKYDPETVDLMDNPQGDADLENAIFAIKSLNDYQVEVDGNSYNNGDVVKTIKTEKIVYDDGSYNYYAYTDIDTLPYGNYEIYETDSSVGYMIPTSGYDFPFAIEKNLEYHTYDLNGNKIQVGNVVQRGDLVIYKYDVETYEMMDTPQGDATLAGAGFTIYNDSRNPVYIENGIDGTRIYQPGEAILYIETKAYTDSDGTLTFYAKTDANALPYGSYTITETKAPTGYLIGETYSYDFTIRENDEHIKIDAAPDAKTGNSGQFDIVIRGGIEIQKRDLESGYDEPEGGASLEGAELTIYNESTYPVLVNGVLYQPGEAVIVLYTDENSYATTGERALPYGTYKLVETRAPEGYLPYAQNKENTKDDSEPVGVLERDFVIRTDGEMIDLTDQNYDFDKQDYVACAEAGDAIYNQVIRGDFAIRKITDDQHTMRGVIFKIESVTTNEYHYFMTDENGAYSSAVDYAEHSYDTNYHDDESTWDETDDAGLRHHVGMWFSGYGNDDEGALVDDSLGALPYDTYKITEIKTAANEGYTIWEDTFTVGPNDNNIIIDLNDIEDSTWDIDTVATFESTNSKYAPVSENTITIDAVSYENLTIGHEYTLVAKLYDKNTQNFVKNAYGEDVMSVTAFTPRLHFGTANTEIVFDSTGLDGHDIVVFEYVYDGDEIIGDPVLYETNPEEANQTLHFPAVQTTALDADTGTHTSLAGETITIVDTVEYSNLQPGREYTVTGTLMNKDTGEPVLTADGEEITSEATFTPDEPDGYVTVVFDFDGTGLEGVVTVVFEHVYYKGIEYAAHADINDDGQTVYIPKIHTTAWAEETGINAASAGEDITLYDTVSYKGVEPDQEYHIFSVLFNAETHEAEVDSEGNEIWSDYGPFTAEESEGQIDVEFNIDASQMVGHRTVFYEILYQVETDEETGETTFTLIAEEDLADVPDETIYFPGIHTNAYDSETGTNIMEARENVTLVDTVTYTNLAPGHEYTVTGVLMDKEAGEAILDAEGNEVTSEAVFTPEESDGTVEVEFTFDATGLEGTTIVVFEDLYYEDIQLTTHANLEDEDQTVYVPEIHTTAVAESTGTHEVTAEGTVTIVDTVEYTNLLPGKTYTMSGELMDEATGDSLGITANTVFTPEEPDGTVDVTFSFDADDMADTTVVVFEECSIAVEDEDVPVAEHKDLTDTDQQVKLTAPPTTDTPTGTPTSTDSPKTGAIFGFSALGAALAAAGAAVAGTVARKKRTGAEV